MKIDGISIIICCYNSSSRLSETIKSLAKQEVNAEFAWEIIVVDNSSNDHTKRVAVEELSKYKNLNIDFKVIDQPIKGLGNARQKGVEESKYELILFCDDDNHLNLDYLHISYNIMVNMPEVGIIGGLSKPKLAYYPGKWIEDMYPAMAIGSRGVKDGYIDWVYGAGMVIRKKIFQELKDRNIKFLLTDRVGTKQFSGGDSEFCELTKFLGYKIYYTSQLQFFHEMQSHRLKKSFFIKGNYRMVFPLVYLFILNSLVPQKLIPNQNELYQKLLRRKILHFFYFFPRILVGRHRFYSFIMAYQAFQFVLWLFLYKSRFDNAYFKIKENLGI